MKFKSKNLYVVSFFTVGMLSGMLQAFEEEKSEKLSDTAVVKRDMYENYDKLDELITYFRKRLDALENQDQDDDEFFDVDEADFVAMYDEMPDYLKQALIRIYFSMSIGEQNEILIALGCNVYFMRALIAKEMQKRIEASAIEERKKEKSMVKDEKKVRFADKQVVDTPQQKRSTFGSKKPISKEKQSVKDRRQVQPGLKKYTTY